MKKILILLFIIPFSIWANVPNTFSNGNSIKANEINENFSMVSNIIQISVHKNCTRTDISSVSNIVVLETIPINKKLSNSTLIVEGTISALGDGSTYSQQEWIVGNGSPVAGGGFMQTGSSGHRQISVGTIITGHTQTGIQNLVFRYIDTDGSNNRPFLVYNPNSSDHSNMSQTCSFYKITEIL